MNFNIITIFPKIFDSYFNESIIKRAQEKNLVKINIHDLRQWTNDKHRTVDDTPYGGGAGMLMKIEPLYKAIQEIKNQITNYQLLITNNSKKLQITNYPSASQARALRAGKLQKKSKIKNPKSKIILLSAKGKKWDQAMAKKYSKLDNIILICGRYEGVDERVTKFIDEEISIGDYVLTGGEIGAMTIVDSITRLLPGVLGNEASSKDESHSTPGVLEYPQYTRPAIFYPNIEKSKKLARRSLGVGGYKVPKILLSGDHKKIEEWRRIKSKKVKK